MDTIIHLEVCDKCGKKVSDFIADEESVYCKDCVEEMQALVAHND